MKFSLEFLLILVTLYSILAIFFTFTSSFEFISTFFFNPDSSVIPSPKPTTPSTLIQTPSVTCPLHPNVFTPEELESIFKYKTYGDCILPGNDTVVYKNRILSVNCENPAATQYFYKNEPIVYGLGKEKGVVEWTKTPPTDSSLEFVFVRCGVRVVHTLIYNRFLQSASKRAADRSSQLNPKGPKMSVFILTVDELSKYNADRNLPSFINFVKTLQTDAEFSDYFSAYEFIRPGITAPFTGTNLAEILYGQRITKLLGTNPNINLKSQRFPIRDRGFRERALWNFYSDLGYTTMFLHDSALDFVSPLLRNVIECDHVFSNIWKYTWAVYGWRDFANRQRCAGNRNAHVISFDYSYQFFDNYRENNRFAYVHLNGAHENSGNVRTIDKDLLEFVKDFLRMVKERGEDLAFWFIGDHGQKKSKNQFDYRMFFEANVPATHLILSKSVENSGKIKETLIHNQDKLFSRLDMHLALKQLAYFPYNLTIDSDSLNYYGVENVYNLISEKIKHNRTCQEIGSKKEFCVCSWFEPVENNQSEEIVKEVFLELIKMYFEVSNSKKSDCGALKKFQVEQFLSFRLVDLRWGYDTLYEIELWNGKNRIKASANFCLRDKIKKTEKKIKGALNPSMFFNIPEGKVFMQLTKVETDEKCLKNLCECMPSVDVQE